MATANKAVGYNVQLGVDTKHDLIAEQEVTNQLLDLGLLAPTMMGRHGTLDVEAIEAVADRGEFSSKTLKRVKRPTSCIQ